KRNFLATLLLSQGVPMLLAGDEIGRTQKGNNNAYCQDNEISWLDWKLDRPRRELLEFTRYLIRLAGEHPVLRRRHFFQGRRIGGDAIEEVDDRGNRIVDDTLLILLNAHHEPVPFVLPAHRRKVRWQVLL